MIAMKRWRHYVEGRMTVNAVVAVVSLNLKDTSSEPNDLWPQGTSSKAATEECYDPNGASIKVGTSR